VPDLMEVMPAFPRTAKRNARGGGPPVPISALALAIVRVPVCGCLWSRANLRLSLHRNDLYLSFGSLWSGRPLVAAVAAVALATIFPSISDARRRGPCFCFSPSLKLSSHAHTIDQTHSLLSPRIHSEDYMSFLGAEGPLKPMKPDVVHDMRDAGLRKVFRFSHLLFTGGLL
jgi:hypothetical protein